MEFGDDLNLGMLSDNDSLGEDFLIDPEKSLGKDLDNEKKETPEEGEIDKKENTSEEKKSPESVAGEEGKTETPGATTSSPMDNDKLSNMYSSLATHFRETGVLPSLEDTSEIKTKEDLENAIKAEITNGLDESTKMYREAMERGEPQDSYVKYVRMKSQLDNITDDVIVKTDNADLRLNIIAQDFLNRGFDRDEAIKFAKRSQDLGEDIEDAKTSLERVKIHNEELYQKDVTEKKLEEEKAVDEVNKFILNTDEIIKGVKITKGTKDNLIKQMTTAIARDEEGNPLSAYGQALVKDPVKTKTITEYLFLISKGFTDFSKINSLIESKTTSDIDKILSQSPADFLSTGTAKIDKESSFSFEDGMEIG